AETLAKQAETAAKQKETEAKNRFIASVAAERQAAYDMTIAAAQKALDDCDQPRAAELLASCPEDLRGWEWHYLNRQFDRHAVVLRPSYGAGGFGFGATYLTPDSQQLLVLTAHPLGLLVERWDTTTGKKTSEREISLPPANRFRCWYTVSP